MSVRIGVIGCGKQAPKHLGGYRADGDVEVVVADLHHERAREVADAHGLEWAPVEDLIRDPGVHGIDICTPTRSHAELVLQAIDAGKAFLVEKPLCESLAVAEDILERAEAARVIGMVGFLYRFVPVFEQGRRLLDGVAVTGRSEALGRVHSGFLRVGGRGSHRLWKHRTETGGGAVNEMLVHMVDLAHWFFGPPADVRVHRRMLLRPRRVIQGRPEEVDAEDHVLISLTSVSGVEVTIQADLLTPAFSQLVEVQGENGSYHASITGDAASFVHLVESADGWTSGRTELDAGDPDAFRAEIRTFLEAVRTGRAPDRCTLREAVDVMRVIDEIQQKEPH